MKNWFHLIISLILMWVLSTHKDFVGFMLGNNFLSPVMFTSNYGCQYPVAPFHFFPSFFLWNKNLAKILKMAVYVCVCVCVWWDISNLSQKITLLTFARHIRRKWKSTYEQYETTSQHGKSRLLHVFLWYREFYPSPCSIEF